MTLLSDGGEHPLLETYSLLVALFLGTMGLPNVLARFYTNPDGRAARRTAVVALTLVGAFYLLPILLGALSRLYTPQLLVSGETDAAVLMLPSAALGSGWAADLLTGLVATGAWAAFLSTATGLAVSVAGVVHSDVLRRGRAHDFRLAAVIAGVVPLGLALSVSRLDFSATVSLAFAVAASTFCPLLVLGIWWRGLTDRGAVAGALVGGVLSTGAAAATLAGMGAEGELGVLLYQPAVVSAPAAFLTMVVVSRLTAQRRPADVDQVLLRLHAPEHLGLSRDRLEERD
jgi:Na+(H+)/acetate symporter ActP